MKTSILLAAFLGLRVAAEGVLPKGADGRPLNLDFEAGNLSGWTAEGNAFTGQPVEGDMVAKRRGDMRSDHQGRFWIGGFERLVPPPGGELQLPEAPFQIRLAIQLPACGFWGRLLQIGLS